MMLPASIAPFEVVITPVNNSNAEQMAAARALYQELQSRKIDVLLDDRDERPGVKFKDADLIGIPLRIAVGQRGLADRRVEWKRRAAGEVELVPLAEIGARAAALGEQVP
jgi:prolyl-tRNA synthetase